ncbi:MAG: glycosyltransferase family 4 protein [Ferruginibacter sp.]
MKSKDILIIYGSLNSVPSPEGAAPAKIIYETIESLNDKRFKVLSSHNPNLVSVAYDREVFMHVKPNLLDRFGLVILKVFYPYRKRKEKFSTSSNPSLLYFLAVCRFLFFNRYEKIIVHVSVGMVSMIKLLFPNRDVVFFHHGTSLHTKYNEEQWKQLITNAKAIFGVNKIAFEKANNRFICKLDASRYFAIPNAIIPKVSLEEAQMYYKNRPYDSNSFVFAFSGRICVEKGVLNLIKAFKKVYESNKGVILVIFGGAGAIGKHDKKTSYMDMCYSYSKENKLPIKFTGFLSEGNLIKSLAKVDSVILPTDNELSEEGMPLCLIEGLSLGKSIIATNSGGNSEVVENGINGLLIESNPYIDELAKAMLKISLDSELSMKFSKAAYSSYLEKYTYENYTKKFIHALGEINYI